MNETIMIQDLTRGSPMQILLRFSMPFILGNLLQQVYNMADMVIVGQFVGSAGLTATSIGGELSTFFLFIIFGFSSAGQIIISQHIGAGCRERIAAIAGTLMTFVLSMAAVFTVAALLCCDLMLELVNVPPEARSYAHDYAFVYFTGMIPVFGFNVISAVLRGMGDSRHPFVFIAIAACTNIVLDLLFVGALHLACLGAALATVLSQALSFVIAVLYLYRHRDAFGFDFRLSSFRLNRREMAPMLKMGLPLSIQNAAVSLSMIFINRYINDYGVIAAAATAVGNKLVLVATICTTAMAAAGNTVIGQNFAAGKYRRVGQTMGCIFAVCAIFCGLLSVIILLFPEQTFSLFNREEGVLALAHMYAPIMVISLMGFAIRSAAQAFINGIGHSRLSFVSGMMDGIVARIGLSLLLGITLGMGVRGFWLGSALAGYVLPIFGAAYYASGRWKQWKPLV